PPGGTCPIVSRLPGGGRWLRTPRACVRRSLAWPRSTELDEVQDAGGRREGLPVTAGGRRVIAGVSGSLRSLGALRAAVAEARSAGAALQAVLAWSPAGGEIAYRRAPCPVLLRLWEQEACERLRDAFDQAFGGLPDGAA